MQNIVIEEKKNKQVDLKLKKFIECIEKLEEEKSELSEQIRETYKEAKSVGFDTKTMKKIVKLRKKDIDTLSEERLLLETYAEALQMNLF